MVHIPRDVHEISIEPGHLKTQSDECQADSTTIIHSPCGPDLSQVTCTNTVGSYICSCGVGWEWVSRDDTAKTTNCNDIDECKDAAHGCHHMAECANTLGSYTCTCEPGYHGDGRTCIKIDYCMTTGGIGTGSGGANECGAHGHCISLGEFSNWFLIWRDLKLSRNESLLRMS